MEINEWKLNPNNYPVIKTARTEVEINMGAQNGFFPLIKKVSPSPEIKSKYSVYQHKLTHEILVIHDYRSSGLNEEYDLVIDWTEYYPYTQLNPFAAYLIPLDLEVGERVFLSDVIEDLVEGRWNQGDVFRVQTCEAIWTGSDLELDYHYPGDTFNIYG